MICDIQRMCLLMQECALNCEIASWWLVAFIRRGHYSDSPNIVYVVYVYY